MTGDHREFAIPEFKPGYPTGGLDLEPDATGGLWIAMMYQGGLARFDKKAESFQLFPVPAALGNDATQQSMVMPAHADVDGKVWTNEVSRQSLMRLDVATGAYELIDPFKNVPKSAAHTPYGMLADMDNNLWFMDFGDANIGKVDAKTLRTTLYPTPTQGSHPRRGQLVGENIWFAEFGADRIGMFNLVNESMREWKVPTPWSFPYDVGIDDLGNVWSGNMSNDRILRLRPERGDGVEYLLPRSTNIRRVFVDNTTTPPSLWVGDNHGASIIHIEPLD